MDDLASLDPERPGLVSLGFIRRTTVMLAVLYRHVHFASVAVEVEGCMDWAGSSLAINIYVHSDFGKRRDQSKFPFKLGQHVQGASVARPRTIFLSENVVAARSNAAIEFLL